MIQCPKCSAENSDDSRFCKSCGEELSSLSQAPTVATPEGEAAPSTVQSPRVGRIVSSDSVPAGGFTPGTILVDRYRIIGLLGRGGMGEVYRADDLKLGQPVALKFLPPKLSDDPVRRERFFAEVRITRQLSHPNICRVYDIGEVDGRHFLSMEYIDGEDLASLMKRIGSLTNEKALDIARQLVAGLTVAHERGVLHRDLKPANIMLDGHGRVRITDFGLAIAAEDESQAEEIAGTPAYMAPEQLAGKGATVRSDIYSLGLILYEIYTGKKAFKAKTLAELREQKEIQTPRAPSELREGIDPVVERVIQRCMEKDPNARPSSVAQLAQALPGGDPLAAAIAAGETPSPEMVAASGGKEGLKPWIAWGLLVFIIVGILAVIALNDRFAMQRQIPFDEPPEALVQISQQLLKNIGFPEGLDYSAYGFMRNFERLEQFANTEKSLDRRENLDSKAILFWYRLSPKQLVANISESRPDIPMFLPSNRGDYSSSRISYLNPPLQFPGETLVVLDITGKLVSFQRIPIKVISETPSVDVPDWKILFNAAGLDILQWDKTNPQQTPNSYADNLTAWQPSIPETQDASVRIEAASFQGKPIGFQIKSEWSQAAEKGPDQPEIRTLILIIGILIIVIPALLGGLYFARRNLRLGRGDRRTTKRLAILVLALSVSAWFLKIPKLTPVSLLFTPYTAGFVWILYLAFEPYVRRRWPQILVSWTRLFSGEWRDPLVARDALAGCAYGVGGYFIYRFFNFWIPTRIDYGQRPPFWDNLNLENILGARFLIAGLLDTIVSSISDCLLLICALFVMRILLRNDKAAIAVCILAWAVINGAVGDYLSFATLLVISSLWIFMLMRFGLLAVVLTSFTATIINYYPVTFDTSAWYFSYGFAALALLAAIIFYAFYTSLGGRPLFGTPRLDD